MAPPCCRCNASRRCKNCSCKKVNKACSNCQPLRLGNCRNTQESAPTVPTSFSNEERQHAGAEDNALTPVEEAITDTAAPNTCTATTPTPAAANFTPAAATCTASTPTPTNLSNVNTQPSPTDNAQLSTAQPSPQASQIPPQPPHQNPSTVAANTSQSLPQFSPITATNFHWGDMTGEEFSQTINTYYEEIVHWKKNIFKIPSGKAGKAFVIELARLLRSYSDDSAMEGIALKAAMTMPALLLQKPHTRSRAKEHTSHLDRRLRLWTAGKLHELIHEGRTIQQNHSRNHHRGRKPTQQTARIFAKLMMEGKVKAALRLINEDSNGTPLKLDSKISPSSNKTVRDILKDKHPQKQTRQQSAILTPNSPATEPHPIHFERLDG